MQTTWNYLAKALEAIDLAGKHLLPRYRCDDVSIALNEATTAMLRLRCTILAEVKSQDAE